MAKHFKHFTKNAITFFIKFIVHFFVVVDRRGHHWKDILIFKNWWKMFILLNKIVFFYFIFSTLLNGLNNNKCLQWKCFCLKLRFLTCPLYTYFRITICIKSHYAECPYADCCYAECLYAECRYAECLYAECLYAECRYASFAVAQTSQF